MNDFLAQMCYNYLNIVPVAMRQHPPALQHTRCYSMSHHNTDSNKYHGVPCSKCGSPIRYKSNNNCVDCSRANIKSWRKNNPDKVREQGKQWEQKNRARRRSTRKKWREENPDKVSEYSLRWKKKYPEKANANTRRYQTQKYGNETEPYDFKAICRFYKNTCLACGRTDVKLTVDHIVPISKGGGDVASNIQPLCQQCNSSKNDKHIDYRPDKGPLRWIQRKLFG